MMIIRYLLVKNLITEKTWPNYMSVKYLILLMAMDRMK